MSGERKSHSHLSKTLSWVLRHGAVTEGLPIQANGFLSVEALLKHPKYARSYTLPLLQQIVDTDGKQRYTMRRNPQTGEYEIRANQGHSLQLVDPEQCLQRIASGDEVPLAVHGTYYRHWPKIRVEGLKCMGRQHVHFATSDESRGNAKAISGFRGDCELLIYLNVQKILRETSMSLYRSSNNVVLCAGLDRCIAPQYFAKVVDRRSGQLLTDYL